MDWLSSGKGAVLNHVVLFHHTARGAAFTVDLYSGVVPTLTPQYGRHALRSLTPLPSVRSGSNAIPVEESLYPYDGTERGATGVLDRVLDELSAFGLPWFGANELRMQQDPLVGAARSWLLEHWAGIPADVAKQLDAALVAAGHLYANADFPPFQQLKDELRLVASALSLPAAERREIQPLSYDALQYAEFRKANAS